MVSATACVRNLQTLEEVYVKSRTEGFGREVKKRILLGTYVLSAGYQDAYYKKASKVRMKIIDAFNHAFRKCDLIAMPSSPIQLSKKGQSKIQYRCICRISIQLASTLLVSLRLASPADSMVATSLGFQLIGPRHSDVLVCKAAHAYEKTANYSEMIPPLFDKE